MSIRVTILPVGVFLMSHAIADETTLTFLKSVSTPVGATMSTSMESNTRRLNVTAIFKFRMNVMGRSLMIRCASECLSERMGH